MARRKRIQTPGLIRHVMSRGNGKMDIFLDDLDRRTFMYLLGDVVEEYEIACWNYCLMSNHYHATFNPTRPNISRAIQKLNGEYAKWWNDRHEHVGHVFQGRFKAQIVQREGYLTTLCQYIALNPVRAGIVAHPADWPWSSYRATVGLIPCPSFLSAQSVLNLFGDVDIETQRARYARHIVEESPEEAIVDRFRSKEPIIGERAFKTAVKAEAGWNQPNAATESSAGSVAASVAEIEIHSAVAL